MVRTRFPAKYGPGSERVREAGSRVASWVVGVVGALVGFKVATGASVASSRTDVDVVTTSIAAGVAGTQADKMSIPIPILRTAEILFIINPRYTCDGIINYMYLYFPEIPRLINMANIYTLEG